MQVQSPGKQRGVEIYSRWQRPITQATAEYMFKDLGSFQGINYQIMGGGGGGGKSQYGGCAPYINRWPFSPDNLIRVLATKTD